ncbi:MAG: hypothetical protein OEZ22_14875 [Spirochaetia bacterium]|nr:hypothetical protein [Spirochaetia bacterium]
MECKYCGKKIDGFNKVGDYCQKSPSEKHIIIPDGIHCVFCGIKIDSFNKVGGSCRIKGKNHQKAE